MEENVEYDRHSYVGPLIDGAKMREAAELRLRGDVRDAPSSTLVHYHTWAVPCVGKHHVSYFVTTTSKLGQVTEFVAEVDDERISMPKLVLTARDANATAGEQGPPEEG
jgi:hypothetical protein